MTAIPPPGQVDLWYTAPEDAVALGLIERYRRWLPEEEVARADRFHFLRDRHQHLVTRALVRTVLSRYVPCDPLHWAFRPNAYGRPEIIQPAGLPVWFNLSHIRGLVVCAVAGDPTMGVDVESEGRVKSFVDLAERFFAHRETAWLRQVPAEQQASAFFQFWTLKEAYIKARGMGLAIPLQDFAFDISPPRAPVVRFLKDQGSRAEQWRFAQLRLADRFQIAVALLPSQETDLAVRIRRTVPLAHVRTSSVPVIGQRLPKK
jgi:4'-phosphopantetheinyl transferase